MLGPDVVVAQAERGLQGVPQRGAARVGEAQLPKRGRRGVAGAGGGPDLECGQDLLIGEAGRVDDPGRKAVRLAQQRTRQVRGVDQVRSPGLRRSGGPRPARSGSAG